MNTQSDVIDKVIARIAEKLNIKKWRYESRNITGNIFNYLGNLVPVALIDECSDVTTHLMIKVDQSGHILPEIEAVAEIAYNKEVYFYTTLVPLFQKNTNNSGDFFPECYFANSTKGDRILVMQNMSVEGFERHDKGRFLDHEHLILSLKAVAKLHSFSLILKEKNIEPQDSEILKPFSTATMPQYSDVIQKCFKKYGVQMFEGTQHETFFKDFYSTMTDMSQFMDDCVTNAHALVHGHGDLWKENFLYKYSDGKPVQACLLDYQMCHLMSPACDVLYLIMNSTDSTLRRQHYQTFLSTYYKTLERSLRANGMDLSNVYSEADFHDDIKLVFPMCFGQTLFSYVMWLGFENLSHPVDAITGPVDLEEQNVKSFMKIIGDLITDFRDFGTMFM